MSVVVDKSYVIKDEETGEVVKLSVLANGNYKLVIESSDGELRPDTFEALVENARELIV